MQLLILDAPTIRRLIAMPAVIEAVEEAFTLYGRGQAQMPPKVYLDAPPYGDFRAMPARLGDAAGIKWVNSHPGNPERAGLPTVMAVIVLNDSATGRPLAVFDGTLVTRLRTGAAAAVATRWLARKDARTLGLIGCGGQGATHLEALTCVMTPKRILLADMRRENAERLAARFARFDCRVVDPEQAASEADVLTTITPSRAPCVRRAWIRPGTHINAMGADAPGKQELETQIVLDARVFVDDWAQASHSGEVNIPVRQGLFTQPAGSLPEVLSGRCAGRANDAEITLFDSTGLAIQDVAVSRRIYQEAVRQGAGMKVDFPLDEG